MSKEILLGPLLGDNRAKLIERCAQLVAEGKSESFLYLAASHPLLELVTDKILDGVANQGLWGDLPVYLFRGFVRRIINTTVDDSGQRLLPRIPIDREELPLKRSLVSQILKQLAAGNKLTALKPLAHREGCVNTVTTLIGEIQRAGKTTAELSEIVANRVRDFAPEPGSRISTQVDFDRDIALIYETYANLLQRNNFTEADSDQLRALTILNGECEGRAVRVPWLENVDLLVLDGFFDFTPVQGEMLRQLIRRVPDVLVSLNSDESNPAIFEPFSTTIEQLKNIADFEVRHTTDTAPVAGALGDLRGSLFRPEKVSSDAPEITQTNIRFLTCADRETEVRRVAKEIKQLVAQEDYRLTDIALVVRERASYADTIVRVMRNEGIPCNLEPRVKVAEIASVRAARKLFEMLQERDSGEKPEVKVADLADLIKSEYFCLDEAELNELDKEFGLRYAGLLGEFSSAETNLDRFKYLLGVGRWDPDTLENTVAFVGGALGMTSWLERARKLLSNWPQVQATTDMVTPTAADGADDEETDQIEDAEKVATDDRGVEKKRRPSRDVHPAAIAWASLVLNRLNEIIQSAAKEGAPRDLRTAVMGLLERLQFSKQIRRPARNVLDETELPHVMLDLRGLEALRRALVAAVKSIDVTAPLAGDVDTRLVAFLGEVVRALDVEVSIGRTAERGGLRVFEATDVRGLRFRAVFIAGLVEGGFPLRASRDWIYPHEERERLKRDYDLTLEDISPATLLKEEHYFYQSACRATEKLFLSRPLLLDDGTETVGSYYINELSRAIRPFKLESEPVRRDFDGDEIFKASTLSELTVSLVRQDERHLHRAGREGVQPAALINELNARLMSEGYLPTSTTRRVAIERERCGSTFGEYDGVITTPELISLLQQRLGSTCVHSASGLSTYGNCGYRFFANRVLRFEPRGEAALDLQAIDAGKLLHDVLRRFFERHRGEVLTEYDRDSLRAELRDVAEQVFKEHERAVPPLNPDIWKIDCEIRKIILDQVLLYELSVQSQTKADVRSHYFELAFGMTPRAGADPQSKTDHLELSRSSDEVIRIQGQIDRVDQATDGTVIAYDYKLSLGAGAEDMKAGRSLQLPIYLEALEQLLLPGQAIAGGGYYILKAKPGRRNSGIYRKDFGEYLGLHAKNSILTDGDWNQVRAEVKKRIWEFFDGMNAGDFRVNPSEGWKTCKFCDYSAVCRYDRYRIDGKKHDPQITRINLATDEAIG